MIEIIDDLADFIWNRKYLNREQKQKLIDDIKFGSDFCNTRRLLQDAEDVIKQYEGREISPDILNDIKGALQEVSEIVNRVKKEVMNYE